MSAVVVPVTLYQCFQEAHKISFPVISPKKADRVKAHEGEVTRATSAPKFSTRESIDYWAQKGYVYVSGDSRALEQQRLSIAELAMYHNSEADVVRAATLYLLHPVNQAFCATRAMRNTIRCLSEAPSGRVRCDIVFRRTSNSPSTRVMRSFALLECKKRGMIDTSEFRRAEQVISETNKETDITARAENLKARSYFSGNALTLIKQAGGYACRYGIQHVALFDWDHLILVKFTGVQVAMSKSSRQSQGVGTKCKVAIIPASESHSMRPALLGFLEEAHYETRHLPSDEPNTDDEYDEFDEEEG